MHEIHTTSNLLTSIRRGSDSALSRLLERLRPELQRIAEAENQIALRAKISDSDLVQESLHDVSRSIHDFAGHDETALNLWVHEVFRNNLRHAQRQYLGTEKRDLTREQAWPKQLSSSGLLPIADDATPLSVRVVKNEEQVIVRLALSRLSPDDQQLLRWRFEEELTLPQMAQRLEKSIPAAKKLLVKAIQEFDQELHRDDG